MPKLTTDQIKDLNHHYADGCSTHGVLSGELCRRTKKGYLCKTPKIAAIRRELVAWLRQTVFTFEITGAMVFSDYPGSGWKPISYPLIARLIGYTDHSAAILAHQKWKRESPLDRTEKRQELTPEDIQLAKDDIRATKLADNAC